MYPALIGAGLSQLIGLFSHQNTSNSTANQPSGFTVDETASAAPSATTSGVSSVSTDVQQLFTDLQSNASSSTGATASTSTIANDLQSLFGDAAKTAGGHHHHHGGHAAAAQGSGGSPFQSIASSLLAYVQSGKLGGGTTVGASSSVTA